METAVGWARRPGARRAAAVRQEPVRKRRRVKGMGGGRPLGEAGCRDPAMIHGCDDILWRMVSGGVARDGLERLFSLGGLVVMPCWLLLLVAPGWRWTQRVATFAAPLLLGGVYGYLLLSARPAAGAGFGSLTQVAALFSVRQALLAGWLHYLAFDLFTGAWEARDGVRLKISRWWVAPCLVLTFLFGPIGLGLYLILRLGRAAGWRGAFGGLWRCWRGAWRRCRWTVARFWG